MTVLLGNWEIILFVILIVVAGVLALVRFLKTPSLNRQELILTWLIQAVVLAEKKFGSKTGKVKLSYVYHLFIEKFGIFGMFVSQETFEKLVDRAIRIMEETFQESLDKLPK